MELITHQDLFTPISPSASFILQRILKAILLDYYGLQNPVFGRWNDNIGKLILHVSHMWKTPVSDIEIKTIAFRMMKFSTVNADSIKQNCDIRLCYITVPTRKTEFPIFRSKQSNLQIFMLPFFAIFRFVMCECFATIHG